MRRLLAFLTPVLLLACSRQPPTGPAPHQIRIVGASAGMPFAEAVAERYTLADADAVAPLARASGSSAGIASFCGGPGPSHPDLAITTRPMTARERGACTAHGVVHIAELRFGWSAMAAVARAGGGPDRLGTAQLAAAIAGPMRRWDDIAPGLPSSPIILYGPTPAIAAGDRSLPLPPGATRRDGGYHPLGADGGLVASTVAGTPGAVGIVPIAYAGRDGLRAIPLDGVAPTPRTVADGRYPARLPLFLLVKTGQTRGVPGLPAMLRLFAGSIDPGGDFEKIGLVPLDERDRAALRRTLASTIGAAQL